ncbi:MAG: ankyrin repeat domain-containing protein [Candidatus Micrarchaeota archaeon]|nr:ankyrin repeat domain-containing protein [Candidatus Micrarchaeota archaeon]
MPIKIDSKEERQSKLNIKLMNAVQAGDLKGTKEAVRQGADVNCEYKGETDWPDWSPLLFASKISRKDIAEFLLDSGARIDHESNSGYTAMILASLNKDKEMCILLLKRHAKLHERTRIKYPTSVENYFREADELFAKGKDQEAYERWQQAFRVRLGDIEQAIREDSNAILYMNVSVSDEPRWIPWKRESAGMWLYMDRRDCYAYLGLKDEANSSFNNAQEVLLKSAVKDNEGTDFAQSAKELLDDVQRSGTE